MVMIEIQFGAKEKGKMDTTNSNAIIIMRIVPREAQDVQTKKQKGGDNTTYT